MAEPKTVSDMFQAGRADVRNVEPHKSKLSYNADFTTDADITFDFSAARSNQSFTTPRAMFIDNGANPSEVEVSVSQTDQFFTVPPNAQGYFPIDAISGSTVRVKTDGGSADLATITFYNYELPGLVWYKFGTFNNTKPILIEGAMDEGDNVAASAANNPVYIGGKDYTTGLFHAVSVDVNGALTINNSSSVLGSVSIKSAAAVDWRYGTTNTDLLAVNGVADAPLVNSFGRLYNGVTGSRIYQVSQALNSDGTGIQVIGNTGQFDDVAPTVVTEGNFGSLRIASDRSLLVANRSVTGANSAVAGTIANNTLLLAANNNRKGATICNNNPMASGNILYVSLGPVCSNASFSYPIQPLGVAEIPFGYVGIITCVFSAASGSALATELV